MSIFKRASAPERAISFWRIAFARSGDRRGAIAVVYAIALPVMVGLVGLGVDFGNASLANLQLKTAADSAALLATTAASNTYLASGSTDAAAVTAGTAAAKGRFTAQTGNLALKSPPALSINFSSSNGGQFQASVTYTAAVPTYFGKLVGFPTITVSGSSVSQLSTNSYVSISVLMDASMSMLLASSQADIDSLEKLTLNWKEPKGVADYSQGSCAFACHWVNTAATVKPAQDYYATAIQNNVTLRLTELQTAVTDLINAIKNVNKNNYSIGLYTFNTKLNPVYAVSTDISDALNYVNQIAPDVNTCTSNCPETYFSSAMSTLTAQTTASGNGTTASTPQKFLFIVTDGIVDDIENENRVVGPVNPKYNPSANPPMVDNSNWDDCANIKALGVTVVVLYTPYMPIPENSYYVEHVMPYNTGDPTAIKAHLQSCASPGNYYFEATQSDIQTQLNNMFTLVRQTQSHLLN